MFKMPKPNSKLHQVDKYVALQWIPGHCGIIANERVDELAKKGTSTQQVNNNPIPFQTLKRIIRRRVFLSSHLQLLEITINNKLKDFRPNSIPGWPRREFLTLHRIWLFGSASTPHRSGFWTILFHLSWPIYYGWPPYSPLIGKWGDE